MVRCKTTHIHYTDLYRRTTDIEIQQCQSTLSSAFGHKFSSTSHLMSSAFHLHEENNGEEGERKSDTILGWAVNHSVTGRDDETPRRPIRLQIVLDSASPAPFPHLAQVFHRGHQGMKIGAQCCLSQIGQLELILFFIF